MKTVFAKSELEMIILPKLKSVKKY